MRTTLAVIKLNTSFVSWLWSINTLDVNLLKPSRMVTRSILNEMCWFVHIRVFSRHLYKWGDNDNSNIRFTIVMIDSFIQPLQ